MLSERDCCKLRHISKVLVISALTGVLPACSWLGVGGDEGWLRDRQGQYLEAQITPPMDIPAGLDSFTIDELYHIPAEAPGERAMYVTPPAPKPIDTRIREGVVIQRFGDRAWIVIGATPGQVWPRLRDYWATENIQLAVEDAVAGTMETAWLPQEGSEVRHRYQVRVEPGLHAGNSEVYVRHVRDEGTTPDGMPVAWPDESQNLDRETTVLASISLYLADRTDIYRASSVSMLAGSIEVTGKARIDDSRAGDTRIALRLDMGRAWSQVGQALNNADIEVLATEREAGYYRVLFSGEEGQDEPGFLRRVFTRDSNQAAAREYNVHVTETESGVSVRAETVDGSPAPYEQGMLIRTINENLI